MLKDAADWLTERGDSQEQREQRMEAVEWAVLIFVVGVVVESVQLLVWASDAKEMFDCLEDSAPGASLPNLAIGRQADSLRHH
jgi:hypothetical protein